MSTATKAIETIIGSLSALQEFPLSIFDEISRKKVPAKRSDLGDHTVVRLERTGKTSMDLSFSNDGKVALQVSLWHTTKEGFKLRYHHIGDDIGLDVDGHFFISLSKDEFIVDDKKAYKRAPSKESLTQLRNKVNLVAQRYFNRVVTVDKF